jgi:hypothetical protein
MYGVFLIGEGASRVGTKVFPDETSANAALNALRIVDEELGIDRDGDYKVLQLERVTCPHCAGEGFVYEPHE